MSDSAKRARLDVDEWFNEELSDQQKHHLKTMDDNADLRLALENTQSKLRECEQRTPQDYICIVNEQGEGRTVICYISLEDLDESSALKQMYLDSSESPHSFEYIEIPDPLWQSTVFNAWPRLRDAARRYPRLKGNPAFDKLVLSDLFDLVEGAVMPPTIPDKPFRLMATFHLHRDF